MGEREEGGESLGDSGLVVSCGSVGGGALFERRPRGEVEKSDLRLPLITRVMRVMMTISNNR